MSNKSVAHDGIWRRVIPTSAYRMSYTLLPAWTVMHLGFVYGALWVQAPELLGGRHLYTPWAGISLGLGAAVEAGLAWWEKRSTRPGRRRRRTAQPAERSTILPALTLVALLAAYLASQLYYASEGEASWLAHAEEVATVEVQMKALIPEVTPATAVYANTFVLKPAFAPYAVAVWYGKTEVEGGSLNRLREAGAVGAETYLFNYEDGQLRDVLPALHEFERTYLLWPETVEPEVAGPAGAERLALPATGEPWQSTAVTVKVPAGAGFYTAYHGPAGSRYRIRALVEGSDSVLAAGTGEETAAGWQEITLSLPRYWSKETTFLLESQGGGVWALPRLVKK